MRRFHIGTAKRSLRREQASETSLQFGSALAASSITPSRIVSAKEQARRIREALSKLGDADREILVMRYVEQYSNRETAYLLEITEATASRRHGRSLLQLRRTLMRLYPDMREP